jgi:hypothetical protein
MRFKNRNAVRTLAKAVVDLAFQDLERTGVWHDDAVLFFEDRRALDLFCSISNLDSSDTYRHYRMRLGKPDQDPSGGDAVKVFLHDRLLLAVGSVHEAARATGMSERRVRQYIRNGKTTRMGYRIETSDPVLGERRLIKVRLHGKTVGNPKSIAAVALRCRIGEPEVLRILREGGQTPDGESLEWAT